MRRRHDLDWLRVGATLLLFPFHVLKTFDTRPLYHLKNAELSPGLDYVTAFIHQWHMPLFFVLAGWAAHGTVARRGARGFVRERLRRLGLPFVTGVVLLCPILKYLELRSGLSITAHGVTTLPTPFTESFLDFLPTFFTRLDRFTWSHLWFLLYLLTFSVVAAPMLVRRVTAPPSARPPSVAALYLPLLPLVLIQTTLRLRWPGVQNLYDDWANVAYYGCFFGLGFALARRPQWETVIAREWPRAAALGLGAAAAMTLGWLAEGGVASPTLTAGGLAIQALSAVAGYCVVVALFGGARRFLDFATPALAYLVDAALPIYVLHQLAIVAIGSAVIASAASIGVKLVTLLAASVAATFLAYHWLVRPSALARVALGLPR
jgi:fucose 4-O-acetylase-like acetyltransferase